MRMFVVLIGIGLIAVSRITAELPEQRSPDGRFSVQMKTNPGGKEEKFTDKIILLQRGKTIIGKKIAGGMLQQIFWDEAGNYVAINNHVGSAGGDTWVFRLSDGKCIGSVIVDSGLVKKATEAMKRLDSHITDWKLIKQIVEPMGWTKEGVLKVEVSCKYQKIVSENADTTHGEEAQPTYDGNIKVEGSKLIVLNGDVEEGEHRTW